MQFVSSGRRMLVLTDDGAIDIGAASEGRFPSDPARLFDVWDPMRDWLSGYHGGPTHPFPVMDSSGGIGAPSPTPRQVFAIGLNYRDHADEGGIDRPTVPVVFTKFPSCIAGPFDPVSLPVPTVDFEAEVVVVIGKAARNVVEADAWEVIAGITGGQDLSDRRLQLDGVAPQQFSLSKSLPGFGPLGPILVTPDELLKKDDLRIELRLNGEVWQSARTADLIFSVPSLVAYLSRHLQLLPGDLIFTGTPAGVGFLQNPPRYLQPGDELETWVEGVGSMRQSVISLTPTDLQRSAPGESTC